ncbi:MAG TPA: hypothetical protein VIH55_07620 [Acidimicrobiia bacterium]
MARPADTLVEIPPPEISPLETRWWGLLVTFVAMVVGLIVIFSVTRPRLPPIDWSLRTGPEGSVNLDSLVATDEGFALLSGMTVDGVLLWYSTDGAVWGSQSLQDAPSQLAAVEGGLVAYGVRLGRMLSPDDDGWVESAKSIVFPDEVRSRQGSGRPSLVDSGNGFLAMSLFGDVWWSADGSEFELVVADPDWGPGSEVELAFDSVCRPPIRTSPDVPPMVGTDTGLVAMISSNPAEPFGIWPVCEPRLWFSEDGKSWTGSEATLGEQGYVFNLAWHEGRFVAVGGFGIGEPAAWTSTTGEDWELIENFASLTDVDLYTIETGPAGWVILGRDSESSDTLGWTSMDGLCWTALPWVVSGNDAAVGAEQILVLDRSSYPEMWQGTTSGQNGSC